MAEEAFHATPSDVEVSEAIVALKKLAEQPEETPEAGGGKIGEGQVGDRMFYLSNPVMHASDELLPTLSF